MRLMRRMRHDVGAGLRDLLLVVLLLGSGTSALLAQITYTVFPAKAPTGHGGSCAAANAPWYSGAGDAFYSR